MALFSVFLLFVQLFIFVSCNGYTQSLTRDDDNVRNEVSLTCRRFNNNINIPEEVADPVWYMNGSNNTICIQKAETTSNRFELVLLPECEGYLQCGDRQRNDVSLPRLLLTYPIKVEGPNTVDIDAIAGDSLVIHCGIHVSATGNYVIEWTESYSISGSQPITQVINNPIMTTNYSLVIDSHREIDTTYFCTAIAKISNHLGGIVGNEITGTQTKVIISHYIKATINDIRIEKNEENFSFFIDASGTNNNYKWSLNDKENNDVTIDPSTPMLTLSGINNGDTIKIQASNVNIHGNTNIDIARVYIVITPTCNENQSSPTSTSIAIVTMTTDRPCNLFSTANDSGITNTVLIIVICICFILVIIGIAFVIIKLSKSKSSPSCKQQQNSDNDSSDNIQVRIGDSTTVIKKSKMNNIEDFCNKIDFIMRLTIKELDSDNETLHKKIREKARELGETMSKWQVDDPPSDRIQTDYLSPCTTTSSSNNQLLSISNLEMQPRASNGINYYSTVDVADNNKKNDILSFLLPTLAEKIENVKD